MCLSLNVPVIPIWQIKVTTLKKVQKPIGPCKTDSWTTKSYLSLNLFSTIISLWLTLRKTELLNSLFAKQCSLVNNNRELQSSFNFNTKKRLDTVIFLNDKISNIIRGSYLNKAHGQGKIAIHILSTYGDSICKPLEIIYKEYFYKRLFPLEWKKGNSSWEGWPRVS